MRKKCLIFIAALLITAVAGRSQDTSKTVNKQPNNNPNALSTPVYPDSGLVKQNAKPGAHSSVNPNRGTAIPSTTSGTLNSTVNPNTELVIPFHKKKKKLSPNAIPDSGTTDAGKK